MKRRDLLKQIEKLVDESGVVFTLYREGASHTIYKLAGRNIVIPRHNEINELTARGILKDSRSAAADAVSKPKVAEEGTEDGK